MATWKQALAHTRNKISSSLSSIVRRGRDLDDTALEDLEETLLEADVPVRLAADLIADMETGRSSPGESRVSRIRQKLIETFTCRESFRWSDHSGWFTVLIVGVNGSGKTTTAAKLAHLAQANGLKPLLGAADTYRAAGSEQLRQWAERVGCDVVAGAAGADAAAVAFDAMAAGRSRGMDVVFVDTAGRMHTRAPLMEELNKVRRSMQKCDPDAPHETWMVLDATLGQNALIQARRFHETTPLSGVIVSKLDGSAKAGFLFGVTGELGVPILFAGLGEQVEDLVTFDKEAFVDALLGIGPSVGVPRGS